MRDLPPRDTSVPMRADPHRLPVPSVRAGAVGVPMVKPPLAAVMAQLALWPDGEAFAAVLAQWPRRVP